MKKKEHPFAKMWLRVYIKAADEYMITNWWNFKKKNELSHELRVSQYHYKKLTGKNITEELIKTEKQCQRQSGVKNLTQGTEEKMP